VRTPFGLVVARGTRFFLGPSRDVIGVFVEEGVVDVTNRAGAVTLRAGEGTNLVAADIAPTPPAPWGAARIAEAMASVA
jgi:ferric-dicitrate binding protein FerR (iron transport regulator)